MTGGSDDARPPKDGQAAIEDAWNALVDEAGSEEGAVVHKPSPPVSGPHAAVGADRLARADEEMELLMRGGLDRLPTGPMPAADDVTPPSVEEPPPAKRAERVFTPPPKPALESTSPKVVVAPRPAVESTSPKVVVAPKPAVESTSPKVVVAPKPAVESTSSPPKVVVTPGPASKGVSPPGAKVVVTPGPTPATSVGASARAPGAPTQREGVERPPLRVFEGGTPASPPPASPPQPVRPARAERPAEPEVPTEPASSGQTPWLWIGVGVLALGVGGYLVVGGKSSGPGSAPQISAGDSGPEPVTKPPAPSGGSADEATSADAPPAETGSDSGGSTPPTSRSDDPREPPPGTPDEIAAVFRRLPVSPSDGPPIGGIGANGIHIDELRMGTDVDGTCSTLTDEFSVSGLDRAGVCVRVVHPREKDELQVLWQKHGGYTRRSKMVVLPKHAYRTRGYLKLRSEYIGEWTVRILSSDGVELARHEFTVVP